MTALLLVLLLQEDPARLVGQLSSERVEERDEAERKLLGLGAAALPALEKATKDPDAEVAGRAARLVRILKNRARLSGRLRAAFPGIEERLDDRDDREMLRLLIEATRSENNLPAHKNLRTEDFLVLAPGAIRAAKSDQERLTVAGIVSDRKLETVALQTAPFLTSEHQDLWYRVRDCLTMAKPEEVVPALEPALTSPSKEVRRRALDLLENYKVPASIAPCARALKDRDIDVRRQALETISLLGFPEAAPHVIPLLREKDPEWMAGAAARVLGRLGNKDALPHLLPLLEHANGYARDGAAESLVMLMGAEVLPRILPLLRDPHPGCRLTALAAAVRFEGPKAVPRIPPFLADPDEKLRSHALSFLAEAGARESLPAIAKLLKDPEKGIRRDALDALGKLGAKDRLPDILPFLKDREVDLRHQAMETIGLLDVREAAPEILKLLKDPVDYMRRDAMEILVRWEVKEATAGILKLMSNPDSLEDAVDALEKLKSRDSIAPDLVPLLASEHESVRRASHNLLEKVPVEPILPALLKLLAHRSDDTRSKVRYLLQEAKATKAIPEARKLLHHADAGVRADAAWLLADLDEDGAVPDLLPLAKDEDPRVRAAAVEGLAYHGDRSVVPVMIAALKDPSVEVRRHALDGVLHFNAKEAAPDIPGLIEESRLRERAWQAFLHFKDSYDPKTLAGLLEGSGPMVQSAVLNLLSQIESAELAPRVLPLLQSADPWVRNGAVRCLAAWGKREEIRPLADDPDMHVRRAVFLAFSDEKPRVLAAIRDPDLRDLAIGIAGRGGMTEAIPDLRKILDEGDDNLVPHAMGALADLGARDLVPQLMKMLEDPRTQHTGASLLGRLGAREAIPAILRLVKPGYTELSFSEALTALQAADATLDPFLRSDSAEDRRRGIWVLQQVRPPDAAARIEPLTRDPVAEVRIFALSALAGLEAREFLGAAAERLLADPDPTVREKAPWHLLRARGEAAYPLLRRLLDDHAATVRREAIRRLRDAWTREDLPLLLAKLRDPDLSCDAAEALGALGEREAIPGVLAHFRAEPCGRSARALAHLGAREAVPDLERLLKDDEAPRNLAEVLCRLGSTSRASDLAARFGEDPFPLNAIRSPALWEKLRTTKVPGPLRGSHREVLEALGKAAGLRVVVEEGAEGHGPFEVLPPKRGVTLLEALEGIGGCHVVLEEDRLRVLDDVSERRFWRSWWRAQRKP